MRRWRLILHSCDTKVTKDSGDDHLPSLLWGQIDVVDDPDIRPRIVHGTDELTAIGRDGDAADFLEGNGDDSLCTVAVQRHTHNLGLGHRFSAGCGDTAEIRFPSFQDVNRICIGGPSEGTTSRATLHGGLCLGATRARTRSRRIVHRQYVAREHTRLECVRPQGAAGREHTDGKSVSGKYARHLLVTRHHKDHEASKTRRPQSTFVPFAIFVAFVPS